MTTPPGSLPRLAAETSCGAGARAAGRAALSGIAQDCASAAQRMADANRAWDGTPPKSFVECEDATKRSRDGRLRDLLRDPNLLPAVQPLAQANAAFAADVAVIATQMLADGEGAIGAQLLNAVA